jgi:transcriptional regulator of heat shock response
MVELSEQGYLRQPHTSAGRVPTPKAMKFYIEQLMEEKRMSITEEVRVKEDVMEARGNVDKVLSEATQALAEMTHSLAIAAVSDEEKVWHSGYAYVFSNPEFADLAVCESLFSLLEETRMINELFFERDIISPIEVLFGEELGWPNFTPIGVVTNHIRVGNKNAALSVIGPIRLSYPRVIPAARYVGMLVEQATSL